MADTLKVGDEVRVFDVNGKRIGQPEDGWIGTVTKVGRTLVYIEYAGRTDKFEMATGTGPDAYRHRSFLTAQHAADTARRRAAEDSLREFGITVAYPKRDHFTTDQLEALADLVRSFTQENTDG